MLLGVINHVIYLGNKGRSHTPWHNRLHFFFGRAVFLLAVANIPVGMILYGSPNYCFALYAVWGFILILGFVILELTIGDSRKRQVAPRSTSDEFDEKETRAA